MPISGKVKFFNNTKGFGFVLSEDGIEHFVHTSGLNDNVHLSIDDEVVFDAEEGDRGLKAVNVTNESQRKIEKELEKLEQELKKELEKKENNELKEGLPDKQVEKEIIDKTTVSDAQYYISIIKNSSLEFARRIASSPSFLMEIEWRELEQMVASVLDELGFSVILTPSAKDGGKDIIAELMIDDQRKVFYIEVKHWKKTW